MKLVVGLGNPGPEYRFSPHNLGFAVVECLARRYEVQLNRRRGHSRYGRFQVGSEEVFLIQPQTFMNRSGTAVREWLEKEGCGAEDLIVIADELDLPWGCIRIRRGGGAAGHHGVESVIEEIGTKDFIRLRMGVGLEEKLEDPVGYLLTPVAVGERRSMEEFVERGADAAEAIMRHGVEKAMNLYNRRDWKRPAGAEDAVAAED